MQRITTLFPVWALLFSLLALWQPDWLTGLKPAIVPLLGVVMLGMGMTLTWQSFAAVLRRPQRIGLGLGLQYAVMPLAAWVIALALGLPPALTAGLVLVGASPGGTASNVVCYLARGDLALSITLTTASTLLAIVATPLLTWVYVGQQVPVPVLDMLVSIFKVVLLPVTVGVAVNSILGERLAPLKHLFPLLSVAAIVLIIAIVVALNQASLAQTGAPVALAVVLHNAVGLAAGYGLGRLATGDARTARTLAIEVGMQNSGLAVALAVKYFSTAAALPGALFSIWHNLSGSLLAAWWSRRPVGTGEGRAVNTSPDAAPGGSRGSLGDGA
jgi:BASS family bile acid:Na+ symporter